MYKYVKSIEDKIAGFQDKSEALINAIDKLKRKKNTTSNKAKI
jgi:hypothetical protein